MSKNNKIVISILVLLIIVGVSYFYILYYKQNSNEVIQNVNNDFSDLYNSCLVNRMEYYNSPEQYKLNNCEAKLQSRNCDDMDKILKNTKNNGKSSGMTAEQHISNIYYLCCKKGIQETVKSACSRNIKTEHGRNTILQQLEN